MGGVFWSTERGIVEITYFEVKESVRVLRVTVLDDGESVRDTTG